MGAIGKQLKQASSRDLLGLQSLVQGPSELSRVSIGMVAQKNRKIGNSGLRKQEK